MKRILVATTLAVMTTILIIGCAQLGVTSSLHTTFTETVGDNGEIEVTTWEMRVNNGLFSKIDEAAMTTAYVIQPDGLQKITQGSDALGMDSTGQIEALTATVEGLASLTKALAPLVSGLP